MNMAMNDAVTRDARHHLSELIEQLFAAHEQFKQASSDKVAEAYTTRWLILSRLEELLRDAAVELHPEPPRQGRAP